VNDAVSLLNFATIDLHHLMRQYARVICKLKFYPTCEDRAWEQKYCVYARPKNASCTAASMYVMSSKVTEITLLRVVCVCAENRLCLG